MNVYDPMDRIVYRHLDQRGGRSSVTVPSPRTTDRLAVGYANASPRTYLGRAGRSPQAA